jgi:hypothetical protein
MPDPRTAAPAARSTAAQLVRFLGRIIHHGGTENTKKAKDMENSVVVDCGGRQGVIAHDVERKHMHFSP